MSSDNLTKNLDDHSLLLQLVSMFQDFGVRVGSLDARFDSLDARFEALEKKVDERFYDTRPMWEAVQHQISELREETEKGFRKLDSKWEMLAREVRDLYADERETERRVGSLESKVS